MKQLLVFLFLLCTMSVSAQDVIVKKDGSTVVCRVVELTESEIVYKKWGDQNGSNYVMERSAASAINYQNGKKVNLSEATNLYTPNNQNDGVQQYNDRALLVMDFDANKQFRKAQRLRTIGWIGGGIFTITGALFFTELFGTKFDYFPYIGGGCIGLGVAWTTVFLLKANNYKAVHKEVISYSPIYQYDIPFNNGSSLSLGADFLNDRAQGDNTIGLGLRYNF